MQRRTTSAPPLKPNSFVQGLQPYRTVHSLEKAGKRSGILKLDWNEPAIPPPKSVFAAIKRAMDSDRHLNWYPDPAATRLKKEISGYTGAASAEILVTNGSDQAHQLICDTFLEKGDGVLILAPTYQNFRIWTENRGAKIKTFLAEVGAKFDVNAFLNAADAKTKLVYLIHPYIVTPDKMDIARLAGALPSAAVVVDEAYFEFCGKSCMDLIRRYNNLIVTRSFSKALCLAGLRLGYACSNEENIRTLSKIHNFKSVNSIAQMAGVEILRHGAYVKKYIDEADKSGKMLVNELPQLGFEVVPTEAGFVLFRHKTLGAPEVVAKLEAESVFVREFSFTNQLNSYMRMNTGTIAQTRELLRRFATIFA